MQHKVISISSNAQHPQFTSVQVDLHPCLLYSHCHPLYDMHEMPYFTRAPPWIKCHIQAASSHKPQQKPANTRKTGKHTLSQDTHRTSKTAPLQISQQVQEWRSAYIGCWCDPIYCPLGQQSDFSLDHIFCSLKHTLIISKPLR